MSNENLELKSETYLPASRGIRFLGYLIDRISAYVLAFLILTIFNLIGLESLGEVFFIIIILVGYYIFFESIWQQTLGKMLCKVKVVSINGQKPTFGQIVGRTFSRLIPFEPLSLLINKYPLGWHDKLSNTLVVNKKYSNENVKNINIEDLKKDKSIFLLIIVIIVCFIVVVSILSTIVLASLGSARERANDVRIISELSNMRAQAELYYSTHGLSYGTAIDCTTGTTMFTEEGTNNGLKNLLDQVSEQTKSRPVCEATGKGWAVSTTLKDGSIFCVDSNSTADKRSSHQSNGTCPTI